MFEINSGKVAKAQKVVIYGVEGIGKSTIASKFPDPLFIDLEGSTNNMNVKRIDPPTSWTLFLQQLNWVKDTKPCKSLIIDTADYLEEYLCKPHVVATRPNQNGQYVKNIESYGYGAGYKHLAEVFGKDFLNLATEIVNAGINVVILAHSMQRKVDLPEEMGSYDRYELKLEKKTAQLTKEWADLLLFLNFKTEIVTIKDGMKKVNKGQGQKRVMYTTRHAAYDAKNRHSLADEYDLDYKYISHIFDEDKENYYYKNENKSTVKVSKEQNEELRKVIDEVETITPAGTGLKEISEDEFKLLNEDERKKIPFDEVAKKEDESELEKVENQKLKDMMKANNISVIQIMRAVSDKGYFPQGTDINNLPADFVDAVLIGAFDQIKKYIEEKKL